MLKKLTIGFVVIAAGIVLLLSIFGIKEAASLTSSPVDKYISKSSKETVVSKKNNYDTVSNSYNILVMGDSLAKGTGDEKGKGFSGYFADYFRVKNNRNVRLDNIAVNGDVSNGLLQIVKNKDTENLIKKSNMIFISIGGNEVSKFKFEGNVSAADLKDTENKYLNNVRDIFRLIRDNNSKCTIVFIGLYNPFGSSIGTDKIELLNSWNYQTQNIISVDSNAVFIPTYDLFEYDTEKYLTIDNFHPNSSGYKAIAQRIEEVLKNHK
ncbi:lysophospholipase L1-like esterase [Clostridium acetobutylicum]|uniref:Acyl-CoA thioesterase family protein n=1 Tax=Clostridium acetobutylicum (strain ATCC 824 / DSM 792 / JCM 1419 / IAM 19013 / LMG 5710 / NBRC 13948 / NRRL B-527 / VKM B-1787 / 2291 / W) TaxID=272562 RepID=Q97ET2_CLOAB|nr:MULTISPECIES: SGNH/GDSL hydrolase family protein [Clostridium]AAK80965.1 acyl-CoA thioesterase family protein [Clostridium acetobutylicum ATCC 824]ADZ22067.1 acyl-CoA thioesterase family protein [Clostridium acetobutylicum EA 2018]AEI34188.1 acyl-CoA thioesterase family protein [Clostridium acetobutylicum DSM 1731]AWV78624.1 acyl-CoA thioesterase [Clostridium acetobutylicum]MBC2393485.1 SGNH/GDSL hydrolase family protein [Clostridium acetobutylicum]